VLGRYTVLIGNLRAFEPLSSLVVGVIIIICLGGGG
jgi:hypothetical protein